MSTVPHHVEKTARAAIISGTASLSVFCVAFIVGVIVWLNKADSYESTAISWITLFFLDALLFFAPGILLRTFGKWLREGRIWAFAPIGLIVLVDLSKVFFGRIFPVPCISYIVNVPTLYLAACWLNAFPDIRDYYKRKRRKVHGSRPTVTVLPARMPPPRPARRKLPPPSTTSNGSSVNPINPPSDPR